uniref:Portal Protein n=1 Tax=virus sp. ctEQ64 TaxID=2825809 RepID=A0A8S5RLB8_9VIRU|nr:MAG TPA: Portal Protein [virus sp. ctEQ64]
MGLTNFFEKVTTKKLDTNKKVTGDFQSALKAKPVTLGEYRNANAQNPGARSYDLAQIKNAVLTDSYLAVAVRKFSQLITKAGYQIKSKNEDAANYVNDRIKVIEFRTKIPFYTLITSIARDLYTYSNSYIIKTRDNNTEKFGLKAEKIFSGGAISGLFLADPASVTIRRNDAGAIDAYVINQEEYSPNDVIHLYIDKMNNADYGTSRIYSALEDVTMLRKAEGLVMTILYRFAIPVLHIKVGNTAEGQYATQKEIDDARDAFQEMPNDGFIVTNERTAIEAITPNMQANQLLKFLEYLELRVFSALNASKSSMGRGGGQSSADNTEALMHDEVRAFQNVITNFIEKYLFTELLLEGGFNPLLNKDDYVSFAFNEVSIDTKIKLESNTIQKYQGNVIDLDEARRELGLSNELSEEDMYAFKITQKGKLDLVDAQANAAIKTAKATAALNIQQAHSSNDDGLDNRKFNGKQASSGPNDYFSNDANPTNQNTDKYSIKAKESLNTQQNLDDYSKNFSKVDKLYKDLSNILTDGDAIEDDKFREALHECALDFAKQGVDHSKANNKTNKDKITPNIDVIDDYSSKK